MLTLPHLRYSRLVLVLLQFVTPHALGNCNAPTPLPHHVICSRLGPDNRCDNNLRCASTHAARRSQSRCKDIPCLRWLHGLHYRLCLLLRESTS
jgi:hypothetical protein